MKTNYDACLARVLKDEGGYTNDPQDPGGPTNFGITIHDYRLYIDANGTAEDVKNMSLADAKAIYRSKYWDAQNCDLLPSGVDYVVFDYGVNSGIGRSSKVLQKLVGVEADGKIGPKTIAAVKTKNTKQLINAICDERMNFLRGLSTFGRFGKGWTNRVEGGRKFAMELATSNVGPAAGAAGFAAIIAALAQYFHDHWMIIGGVGAVALVGGLYLYHKIKGNKDVAVAQG